MKKLIILASSAAMLCICSFANAQTTDTTSANYHYQKGLEKTGDDIEEGTEKAGDEIKEGAEKTEDKLEQGAATVDQELDTAGNKIEQGYQETKSEVKEDAAYTKDKVEEGADKTGDKASQITNTAGAQIKDEKVEAKVGPNNEPIFITENAEYYYIDADGQKVMVKKSELKDKKDNK
jgi:hypothetical protein